MLSPVSTVIVRSGLLGELPDTEIAARLGCSQSAVCKIRNKLGIRSPSPVGAKRQPRLCPHCGLDVREPPAK